MRLEQRPFRAGAGWAIGILWAAQVAATLYVVPPDEVLLRQADLVVYGEVRESRFVLSPGRTETDHVVEVEETLKGRSPGGTVVVPPARWRSVRWPGLGNPRRSGALRRRPGPSVPAAAGGRRLRDDRVRARRVLRGRRNPGNGRRAALREAAGRRGGDRACRPIRWPGSGGQARLPRAAGDFRSWLRDRARGVERPADYFVRGERGPGTRSPLAVAQPYLLYEVGCNTNPLPRIRWREFDRGESVDFELHAAGSPGNPGRRLHRGGERHGSVERPEPAPASASRARERTSDIVSARTDDGKNQMLFEDPFDDISGSFDSSGGTAAIITWSFDCTATHFIPDGGTTVSVVWLETDFVTQDGLRADAGQRTGEPRRRCSRRSSDTSWATPSASGIPARRRKCRTAPARVRRTSRSCAPT